MRDGRVRHWHAAFSEANDLPFHLAVLNGIDLFAETSLMEVPQVTLYSRQGCCLCDDAHQLLIRNRLHPTIVDIDADEQLRQQFTNCVPVVEINGKIRFRGRVNEVLLHRLLQHESLTHQ